jgi:hypothetical protein
MKKQFWGAVIGTALISGFTGYAMAEDSVIIRDRVYTCQNTCVVGITPNGGFYVIDSNGGYVKSRSVYTTHPK